MKISGQIKYFMLFKLLINHTDRPDLYNHTNHRPFHIPLQKFDIGSISDAEKKAHRK